MRIAEKAAERAGVLAVRLTNAEQRIAQLKAELRWALGRLNDARACGYGGVDVSEIEDREALLAKEPV